MAQMEEPDRLDGVPHPRHTRRLLGHGAAETALLAAYRSGRMPHAWLLGGPEGIGKATLAYRVARFVLAYPDPGAPGVAAATDLSVPSDHPVARRIDALSHGDLVLLRRQAQVDKKSVPTEISVDVARKAAAAFASTSGEGGWRVAILDCAEDLNRNSANALLKLVEEPPPRSLFLIVSHRPGALLPTIRSRVRRLTLTPLSMAEVADATAQALGEGADLARIARAAALAGGSVRAALKLLDADTLALVEAVRQLLDTLPGHDRLALHRLAEKLAGRAQDAAFGTVIETVFDWLTAQTHAQAAQGPARLAPLAQVWDKSARAVREAETYNLDRRSLVLSIFADLAEAMRGSRAA
jgi:DNA polymerase III subunit delta'